MTSNDEIMMMLGTIKEAIVGLDKRQSYLQEDFREERDNAHDSRAVIHRRLDEQATEMGKLRTDVAVSGKIEAQLRDRVERLSTTVDKNHASVTPALDDWRRVKFLGWGVGILFLSLGISAASIYAWAWDWAKNLMRVWLR